MPRQGPCRPIKKCSLEVISCKVIKKGKKKEIIIKPQKQKPQKQKKLLNFVKGKTVKKAKQQIVMPKIMRLREGKIECAICYETIIGKYRLLECNHRFCKDCIFDWIDSGQITCPYCRDSMF